MTTIDKSIKIDSLSKKENPLNVDNSDDENEIDEIEVSEPPQNDEKVEELNKKVEDLKLNGETIERVEEIKLDDRPIEKVEKLVVKKPLGTESYENPNPIVIEQTIQEHKPNYNNIDIVSDKSQSTTISTKNFTEEEFVELLNRHNKIIVYFNEFKEKLKEFNMDEMLECQDIKKLDRFLIQIRCRVAMSNSCDTIKGGIFGAALLSEKIGCSYGYKLSGMTNAMMLSEPIMNNVKQIACEYAPTFSMNPLAMLGVNLAMFAYTYHKSKSDMEKIVDKSIPLDIVEKYKDL